MIRPWLMADVPQITQIESVCFTDAWTERMLCEITDNPCFTGFISEEGGEITGYVGLLICDDAEVALIAVRPENRRQGVASTLLSRACEYAEGVGAEKIFLEVRAGNTGAIGLYGKHGFVPIAMRPKYYSDGEDAIVMMKFLTKAEK